MGHVIAVYNFKGGIGKTTTTLNIARNWSSTFKVLMIDCDPQANLTQSVCGAPTSNQNLFDLCKSSMHHANVIYDPVRINPYLDLIPASILLSEVESNNQFISFGNVIFGDIVNHLKVDYDFVLIDCPSHFGLLVKAVLANSNSLLIPSIADSYSLSGISELLQYIYTLGVTSKINLLGIFFNMFQKNTLHQNKMVEKAKQQYGNLIINQTVRRTIKMNEASDIGQTINHLDPESNGAKDVEKLCDELLDRFDRLSLSKYIESSELATETELL